MWPKCNCGCSPSRRWSSARTLSGSDVQARLAALLPFYAMPSAPLRRGRVLYLKGKFLGDDGAIHYYQMARPSQAELAASSAHPLEKLVYLRGKQDASYWLGLIAYPAGELPVRHRLLRPANAGANARWPLERRRALQSGSNFRGGGRSATGDSSVQQQRRFARLPWRPAAGKVARRRKC